MKAALVSFLILLAVCSAPLHAGQVADRGSPAALPGDTPLPSLEVQLHKDLGPAAGTHAVSVPAVTTPALSLDIALAGAQAAIAACRADGYRIGVAVTNAEGQILAGLADDGSAPGRIYVAVRKDLTALAFKESTLSVRSRLISDPAGLSAVKSGMSVFSGGVPISAHGNVVGAIASSGSTGNEDDKCAHAGAHAIEVRLS